MSLDVTPLAAGVPLASVLARVRGGEWSIADEIDRAWGRVVASDPFVRAMLPEPDRLPRLVRAAAGVRPDAPLAGALIAVKDVFNVDELPTRAGSRLLPEEFAGPEASVVTRLRDAGALVLGKNHTTEFAYFAPAPTRNPHDVNRTPGGSSSGSAAAVAAGFCPLAIGTQTAGSVIRPAAFCGVVGFKATYGRIPIDGCVSFAPSLDTVGLFATDVAGIRQAASAVCDDWRSVAPSRPVLGVPDRAYLERADADAREVFVRSVAALRDGGYEVRDVPVLDDIDAVVARHGRLMAAEAAREHVDRFARFGRLYHPQTAAMLRDGQTCGDHELAELRAAVLGIGDRLAAAAEGAGVDLWAAPAAAGIAPLGLRSTGVPDLQLPWTGAGVPVVTIPWGRVSDMPLGLQLAGTRRGTDEEVIAWASDIEALAWADGAG